MSRSPGGLLFLLLAFSYLYFFGTRNANSNARYDQTISIVAHGTLSIDRYVANTVDWSRRDGRYYPNKPPGMSLLGVPPYCILYHAQRLVGLNPLDPDGWAWWLNFTLLNALLNVLPAGLAALALAALLTNVGLSTRASHLVALCWALGTLTFPFATSLFSHSHVASVLLIALWLLAIDIGRPSRAVPVTPPYVRVRIRRFGGLRTGRT